MSTRSGFSAHTLSVLAALYAQPPRWRQGYALAKARAGARATPAARSAVAGVVP